MLGRVQVNQLNQTPAMHYPGQLVPLKESTHTVNHGTWSARWWVNSYQTANGVRWGANRFGVRLSGYASLDSLLDQLKNRAS
jgi:hypothetical protein